MEHFKLLTIFLPLIIVISANDSLRRYCGPYLSKALEAVCTYHYYKRETPLRLFGTSADSVEDDYRNDRYDYYELRDLILTQKPSTQAPLNDHYYKRDLTGRSIVSDCCIKSCSTATLRLYCA